MDLLPDGTGRSDKKECVLPNVLWDALKRINSNIKEEYLKAGFDEYMPKPIDIYQFDSIIKKYCQKK